MTKKIRNQFAPSSGLYRDGLWAAQLLVNRYDNYKEFYKFEKGAGAKPTPACTMAVVFAFPVCNTCCCNKGLVVAATSTALVRGESGSCRTWYILYDAVVR